MKVRTFEPSASPFKTLYVDVTHRCQMNCSNCYLPNRTIPDMDASLLYACIKQLPHKTDLRLIGGEPTLRSDLPEIVREIKRLGHRPMLITNGLRLAERPYAAKLKGSGLDYAQLSMNGFQYDSIYKLTDQMSCADKKMAALMNCESVDIRASISCILIRGVNTHLMGEIIEFAQRLKKPARINFRNIGSIGRNMSKEHAPLTLLEMTELLAQSIGRSPEEVMSHRTVDNQIRIPIIKGARRSQQIILKITDWSIFAADQIVDPKANARGRITQDFKVAPSFEHIKENEFGY